MVYNYTTPRRPIAAMYSGPGPAYVLPNLVGQRLHDPRSVHYKGPAWHFGLRRKAFGAGDQSPGPCYRPEPNMFRNGKDGTPSYSLYSRRTAPDGRVNTPGPGAYNVEDAGKNYWRTPPAYSLSARYKTRSSDDVPGPNIYQLDSMMCKTARSSKRSAPAYGLSGRSKIGGFHEDLAKTPGPNNYTVTDPNIYMSKSPGYSLVSRNTMPGDGTTKPGPQAYRVEDVTANKPRARSSYMGIRHSQYKGEFVSGADACE